MPPPKTAAGEAFKFDASEFDTDTLTSSEEAWWLWYGPPKTGKTKLAATLSAYYEERKPFYNTDGSIDESSLIDLADCYWLMADQAPTDSLIQWGMRIGPGGAYNLRRHCEKHGANHFITNCESILAPRLEKRKPAFLVLDTVTDLARAILDNYKAAMAGAKDKRGIWDDHDNDHYQLRLRLGRLAYEHNARLILLGHSRVYAVPSGGNNAQAIEIAQMEELKDEALGRQDIGLDMVGKTAAPYISAASLVAATKKIVGVGNKPDEYQVLPAGDSSFTGGTRYRLPRVMSSANNGKLNMRSELIAAGVPLRPSQEEE